MSDLDRGTSKASNPRASDESITESTNWPGGEKQGTVAHLSKTTKARVGKSLGRYEIRMVLGQGGMGAVYLARDTQLDRDVALKIPHFVDQEDPAALDRFHREAKAAARLRHTSICPTYDVGAVDGLHYITMAYIRGKPLSKMLKRGKAVQAEQVAKIIYHLADALREAHSQGVVHRDLKPANIMMTKGLQPVITDFGLARRSKLGEADESRLTTSGMILGTPAYMPPEQVTGDIDAIGPRSDIFSLGVMMYELLTGELPFEGPVGMVLGQIMTVDPKKPSEVYAKTNPRLESICLKAMAKKPEDRYESMAQLASELKAYLHPDESTHTGPTTSTDESMEAMESATTEGYDSRYAAVTSLPPDESVSIEVQPDSKPARDIRPQAKPRRWNIGRMGAIAAGLLSLAVLAGIIVKIFNKDGKETGRLIIPEGGSVEIVTDKEAQGGGATHADRPDEIVTDVAPSDTEINNTVPNNPSQPPIIDSKESGGPISRYALVTNPTKIEGVVSWTIDTRNNRGGHMQCEYSPNGQRIAAAGVDGTIRIYDSASLRLERLIASPVHGPISWSSTPGVLIQGGHEGTIYFFDVQKGVPIRKHAVEGRPRIQFMSSSGDNKTLLLGTERQCIAWSEESGTKVLLSESPWVVDLTIDGRSAFSLLSDGTLQVWNVASGEEVHRISDVVRAEWSPNGQQLAIATSSGISVLGTANWSTIWEQKSNNVEAIGWSRSGDRIANYQPNVQVLQIWDAKSGGLLFESPNVSLYTMSWHPDGESIVAATGGSLTVFSTSRTTSRTIPNSTTSGSDYQVCMASHGRFAVPHEGIRLALNSDVFKQHHAWSPDGKYYAAGANVLLDDLQHVIFIDNGTGKEFELEANVPGRVAFSTDSKYLICSDESGGISTWNVSAPPTRVGAFSIGSAPHSIACDSNGNVCFGLDDEVAVYDLRSGKLKRRISSGAMSLAMTPDGLLATPSDELKIWDVATGDLVDSLPFASVGQNLGLQWTSSNELTIVCEDRTIRAYNFDSTERGILFSETTFSEPGIAGIQQGITCMGGRCAVWPIFDCSIRMVDLRTKQSKTMLYMRNGRWLEISPDGHYRGSPRIEREIMYVVRTNDGQEMLTPAEFANQYGWKNEPARVWQPAEGR